MKIQLARNVRGDYYFRIIARNGNILANSESYSSKTEAVKSIKLIVNAKRIEVYGV